MIYDFIIGLLLMNALMHFILGTWKGRMLSGFGFGNKQNILYGLVCFFISISLFLYQYGIAGLLENGIYLGGISLLIVQFAAGNYFYNRFKTESNE